MRFGDSIINTLVTKIILARGETTASCGPHASLRSRRIVTKNDDAGRASFAYGESGSKHPG